MSKIDVSKIEGYAEMSAEDKLKALEAYEFEEPDMSGYVSKETFDKTASELATKKKELKAKMSEEEAKRITEQEERETLLEKIAVMEKREKISDNTKHLLEIGYPSDMAEATAKALVEGDTKTVFNNLKAYQQAYEKKVRADVLAETPRPDSVGVDGKDGMTLSELKKMSAHDRAIWARENPEEYNKLYTGG